MRATDAIEILKELILDGKVAADTQIHILFLYDSTSLDMLEHAMNLLREREVNPKHLEELARIYDAIDQDILYDVAEHDNDLEKFDFLEEEDDDDNDEEIQEY